MSAENARSTERFCSRLLNLGLGALYHGTQMTPSSLEGGVLKPSRDGLFGPGVYLSNDAEDAMQYGENLLVVRAEVVNPFFTICDYSVAMAYQLDSPAGQIIIDVFGPEKGAAFMRDLAQRKIFGEIGHDLRDELLRLGHDAIIARWPGSAMCHLIALEADSVQIESWLPYPINGEINAK